MSRQDSVLQHAFILHTRQFRETSLIADLLSEECGRVSVIFRGVRGKKSRTRALLQPFSKILVSWQGARELKTVTSVESSDQRFSLSGHFLYSGLYVNELLQRLLHPLDPHPELYQLYSELLSSLSTQRPLELSLRLFEMQLLELLGYGLPLYEEAGNGESLAVSGWYHFVPENGFFRVAVPLSQEQRASLYPGKLLIALAEGNLDGPEQLFHAKRLMRSALAALLGNRPLRSRELFK